jgi:hypothetical protein
MTDDETAAQSALSAWGGDESDDTDEVEESNSDQTDGSQRGYSDEPDTRTRDPFDFPTISDEAVFTVSSCPWCLHPASDFRLQYPDDSIGEVMRNPLVSCGNCSACIPVEEDWYRNGEKICVEFVADEYEGPDTVVRG